MAFLRGRRSGPQPERQLLGRRGALEQAIGTKARPKFLDLFAVDDEWFEEMLNNGVPGLAWLLAYATL